MKQRVFRGRQVMAGFAAVCAGALAVSCGSARAPSSAPTVSVTASGTPSGSGTPSVTASPATPAVQAAPGPCATSALRMTLGPWQGAAAGHSYRPVVFTNVSGASCTLYGYPGLSFVTAIGGHQVGAAAGRNPVKKRLVTLAAGGKAHALVDMLDVMNFSPSACPTRSVHWLKVYPPNQFAAVYVRWTATVCSQPKPVFFFVNPVRPGT